MNKSDLYGEALSALDGVEQELLNKLLRYPSPEELSLEFYQKLGNVRDLIDRYNELYVGLVSRSAGWDE